MHALRPLNQPIKIVGVDPFVVFGRRQRKGRPQVVGDERCLLHAVAREVVVVHREDDHVLEVEVAGFQDAHYLQSLQRFALERNAERLEVAAQQRGIGFCFDGYAAGFERVAQFVDFFGDDCQEFGPLARVVSGVGYPGHRADDFQQPVGEFLPVFGRAEDALQQAVAAQPRGVDRNPAFVGYLLRQRAGQRFVAPRNIGMVQQSRRVRVVESRSRPFAPAAGLQRHQPFHKGVGQRLFERIAHRHIDLARFCGQRVEQRQQQIFVGQHHRRPFVQRRLPGIFAQDFRGVFALYGIRHRRNHGQLLGQGHAVVREFRARRKKRHVFAHEHARFLLGIRFIIGVVVPVEVGFGRRGEEPEQDFLAFRQCVESRHHVAPGFRKRIVARFDFLGRGALYHAPVGDAQRGQPFAVAFVDGPQRLPDCQEAAFLLRQVGFGAQRRPEAQDLQLGRRQIRYVGFQFLDFRQVAE